jgi:Domain of unknown function (DUF4349)
MSKRWIAITVTLILGMLAACASQNASPELSLMLGSVDQPAGAQRQQSEQQSGEQQAQSGYFATNEEIVDERQPNAPIADLERVILKNASVNITVNNSAAKVAEITAMAESMGGWVVSSNSYSSTNNAGEPVTYGSITVRVPAERLHEAIERIKTDVISVESESINGQDVTQEYVDLSSQLTNLQATERQLQTVMESARRVEDVLAVQRELTHVQGQIETIQGRLKYFDEASTFSSIQVEVRPPMPGVVEAQNAGWNPGETVENAVSVLLGITQFVIDSAITLIIIGLPFALVIGIPVWLIWRRRRMIARPSQPAT